MSGAVPQSDADAPEPARDPGAGLTLPEVHLALGQIALDRGKGAAALDWFRAAARAGDARGFNMIGRCHERGWGVPPDAAAAARHYRRAAMLGDTWALFNLADLHCRGLGVAQDDAAAFALYLAAARRGHVKSLNMLGLFLECGRAVPADAARAADCFRAAGDGGDCWGAFNCARLLLAEKKIEAALPWFERALATGFADFHGAMADALEAQADDRLVALARRAAALAQAGRGRRG